MEEHEGPVVEEVTAAPAEELQVADPFAGRRGIFIDWRALGIIALAVAIVVVVSLILYGLLTHPRLTAGLRDIAIITLALVTMITSIFLAILLFQLQSLIVLLRDEIQPILEAMNETAGTVRGTTTFVSDAVVTPMIGAASYARGIGQTVKALTWIARGSGRKRGTASSPKTSQERPAEKQ